MGSNVYKNTTVRIVFNQESPSSTWAINHGIGTSYPIVDVYILQGGQYVRYWAMNVTVIDTNNVQLDFSDPVSGYATVM